MAERTLSTGLKQFNETDPIAGSSSVDFLRRDLNTGITPRMQEATIMEKFAERRRLASEGATAQGELITSRFGEAIADTGEDTERSITGQQESQRGFAVNVGVLRDFVKAGDRRVRDLTRAREELLLQNKVAEASRLDVLLEKEETSITTARTNFLNKILRLGQEERAVSAEGRATSAEDRAVRSFQTPDEIFTSQLATLAPDAGITSDDDRNTASTKYRNSGTYRRNVRQAEANIASAEASAAASRASTQKIINDQETKLSTLSGETFAQEVLTEKIGNIDKIITHEGLNSRVGPTESTRRKFAAADFFGKGQDFAGKVQQMVSKDTIDTLISLKARGGTLGALSDKERILLQTAATAIGAWEIKDENGFGIGEWNIDEASFKKELETLKRLANKALLRAGGTPASLGTDDIAGVDAVFGNRSLGGTSTNTSTTPAFNPSSFFGNQ